MARFRLRDTTEAVKWDGTNHSKVVPWGPSIGNCNDCRKEMSARGKIQIRDRFQKVCPGDWIVESPVQGSIPVRPHVFEAMYIPVMETE